MKKNLQKIAIKSTGAIGALQLAAGSALAAEVSDITAPKGFASDLGVLLNSVLSFVMVIAALLVFLYLIMGGIEWITSGGDKGKTESARNKITAAIVGLVILAASYAILLIVLNFLGFGNLNDVFDNVQDINQ